MERLPDLLAQVAGPHQGALVFTRGQLSKKALILLHGRGGSAADIAHLYDVLETNVYTLIPEAVGNTWYPARFLLPQLENQPALDSALAVITALFMKLETLGISAEDTVIAGFSQGACLTAEYLKRHPKRYAGAVLMSGGVIGSDAEVERVIKSESLQGTSVYIGCDRADDHIPLPRVEMTAQYFAVAGADVHLELFTGYGHRPHPSAIEFLKACV